MIRLIMTLLVAGGSGLVGRAVCRAAVLRGFNVVSLSRSGVSPLKGRNTWESQVQWIKGDVLDPSTYRHILPEVSCVVHAIGTLFENEWYKKLKPGSLPSSSSVNQESSYERLNYKTAAVLAESIARSQTNTSTPLPFVYLSAQDGPPLIDPRYLQSKRNAESLLSQMPELRAILLRPAFMYNSDDGLGMGIAASIKILDTLVSPLKPILKARPCTDWDKTVGEPLPTHVVADAILNSFDDPMVNGVLSVTDIRRLADDQK